MRHKIMQTKIWTTNWAVRKLNKEQIHILLETSMKIEVDQNTYISRRKEYSKFQN